MKELVAGIVLIVVVGLGGFLYRNMIERNAVPQPESVACTMDAMVCPDGSSVGRIGPLCAFAPCPGALSTIGISFTAPAGYVENKNALGEDATLLVAYEKATATPPPHAIVVRRFEIPEGKTANDVMLANTMLEPSGATPELSAFADATVGTHIMKKIVLERFEGHVHSAYYLVRAGDVLRFEILERDVTNWTDPALVVEELPEHQAFLGALANLVLN